MMSAGLALASLGAVAMTAAPASAKSAFPDYIPAEPDGCETCHISTKPFATWNDFGVDVRDTLTAGANGFPDWSAVCNLDSDGDGFTNGQELGDPNCQWVFGAPFTPPPHTAPGDAADAPQPVAEEPPDAAPEPAPEAAPEPAPEAAPEPAPEAAPEPGPEPMPEMAPDAGTPPPATDDSGCASASSGPSTLGLIALLLALMGLALNRRRGAPSQVRQQRRRGRRAI